MSSAPPAYDQQKSNNNNQESAHDQIADQKCFLRTVSAFRNYQSAATKVCEKRCQDWKSAIPSGHVEIFQFVLGANGNTESSASIPPTTTTNEENSTNDGSNNKEYEKQLRDFKTTPASTWKGPKHFETQLVCIRQNQALLDEIAVVAEEDLFDDYFPNRNPRSRAPLPRPRNVGAPSALDQDKVFSTLRQIVRDWSKEGEQERHTVYDYFYEQLEKAFPDPKTRNDATVLVPGGGLSRLMVEIASRGFSARGNEFSYHMLMAGHYIMNHIGKNESVTIFPYCDIALNHWNRESQFQAISFPDESATSLFRASQERHGTPHGDLSMVAGDFIEVFSKEEEVGQWSAVASCFFLDTAHNVVDYLQVIHQCLRPGGLLINVGPLLFHWADSFDDVSIEITYDELKRLLWIMGFEIVHEKVVRTAYTNNANAMKQNFYQCPAFVAKKVEPKYKPSGEMTIDPDRYFIKKTNQQQTKQNPQNNNNKNTNNENDDNNGNESNQNNNRGGRRGHGRGHQRGRAGNNHNHTH